MPETSPAPAPLLIFFSPERTDARSIKRIEALQDQGWKVLGLTFHRAHVLTSVSPTWEDICLGVTYSKRYFQRAFAILRSLHVIWQLRHRIRTASCLYAINADNSLLALFARWVSRRRIPLAVEIADIQPAMNRPNLIGKTLRFIERVVLRRSQLLITTSPGFLRHYFTPIQHYHGPHFLLENKVYPPPAEDLPPSSPPPAPPWRIGYFGVFRCQRSLDLIAGLAQGGSVEFYLRGVPGGGIDAEAFRHTVTTTPGITWEGGYTYPTDLPSMYSQIHLSWCFDFSAAGANSAWLLPNRIYEGGLHHRPALTLTDTETAHWILEKKLGWSFPETDLQTHLHHFLTHLTPDQWAAVQSLCQQAPPDWFIARSDYQALTETLLSLS